jgi:hypothetical protein
MELIETSVGLPNNCTVCGKPITTETWFAEHIDGARSGVAGHKACMTKLLGGEETSAPAPTSEEYPTKASRAKAKAKAKS